MMSRSALLISILLCGTSITANAVQNTWPLVAAAKTKVEIGRIAKNITFRIEATNASNIGSGVLLQKQGDVYTVLTAAHVVREAKGLRVIAPDGKIYPAISVKKAQSEIDLATIKFRSNHNYQIATIGTANLLESGSEVYVAGFPAVNSKLLDGVFNFTQGQVTGNASNPDSNGYSLIYNSITLPGMSGGPVLNDEGRLVAIHGQGDRTLEGVKTGFNSGITIERFGTVANALGVTTNNEIAPLPKSTALKSVDFLLLATEKEKRGDYSGALDSYNQAIGQAPNNSEAYKNRGILKYRYLNDIPGAMADYTKAIELNPRSAYAYDHRGYLQANRLNDISAALTDFNKAIELDPKFLWAYYNRGVLRDKKLNDTRGALADYNKAIELNPGYANAYYQRGLLKKRLKDLAGAIKDRQEADRLFKLQG
jgi:tetratricopeptide (TPR) repeat protein